MKLESLCEYGQGLDPISPVLSEPEEASASESRTRPLVLGALGLVFVLFALVEGESAWNWIHFHLVGWFGLTIPALPVIFLYSAFKGIKKEPCKGTVWKLSLFFAFLSIFIFLVGADEYRIFSEHISWSFESPFLSSGSIGAIIGVPFLTLFGKAGGIILVVLCLVVLTALLTKWGVGKEKTKRKTSTRNIGFNSPNENNQYENLLPEQVRSSSKITDVLSSLGVDSMVVGVNPGASVTTYELKLGDGVRISRVKGLAEDISFALGVPHVRIEQIPGKSLVGVEVPNRKRTALVRLSDFYQSVPFRTANSKLTICMGMNSEGREVLADIATMPHLLVAGTTGSGKSVFLHALVMSILYRASPDDVRFIMIDPKMVELAVYDGLPHLLTPVISEPDAAADALTWTANEMERRYKLFAKTRVRDIDQYNRSAPESIPKIVIIIDEFADLMACASQKTESAVKRIVQKARAAGIHVIIATQRPSVNVMEGVIKANLPARVAFHVASPVDSQTILHQSGAEKLLGKGDMLYASDGQPPVRIQGCFVSDSERARLIRYIRGRYPGFGSEIVISANSDYSPVQTEFDDLFDSAVKIVVEAGQASTAQIQSRLSVGYPRAVKIISQLEREGVIGGHVGSRPRDVFFSSYEEWQKARK